MLSIIIVSWNTREILAQCLDSIFTYPPEGVFDIWVVDNASKDSTVAMLRQRFPQVHVIENCENVGFARANNQAIQNCDGRYILLLNPDTIIKQDALNELMHFMKQHPEAGGAGPMLINMESELQPSCSPFPTLWSEFLRLFHLPGIRTDGTYLMDHWDQNASREVDVIQGASLIMRRDVFDKAGFFDEVFFIYSEEVDLCYRVRKVGYRLYWIPKSKVVHLGGQSTQQVSSEMFMQLYRSKIQWMRKHHGRTTTGAYKLILYCAAIPRLMLGPLSWHSKTPNRLRYQQLAANYRWLIGVLTKL